jgi:hypothetical protein
MDFGVRDRVLKAIPGVGTDYSPDEQSIGSVQSLRWYPHRAKSKQISAIISPTTLARRASLPRVPLEDKAVLLITSSNSMLHQV